MPTFFFNLLVNSFQFCLLSQYARDNKQIENNSKGKFVKEFVAIGWQLRILYLLKMVY